MSTDYAEMERDFVASLKEDTGRDLSGWMTAIKDCGHNERNEIIDWLRHQGFQFSWASWLERIHHNGGRLIYSDDNGPPETRGLRPPDVREPSERPLPLIRKPMATPAASAALTSPQAAPAPGASDDIQRLLSGAKGLRPLADLVLREIARVVPGAAFAGKGTLITIGAPEPFAVLLPSSKALRLYANFGAAGIHRTKPADTVNRAASSFSDMLIIDDARSIDEDFLRLIRAAAKL